MAEASRPGEGFLEAYYAATSNILGYLGEMYSSLSSTISAPAGALPAGHAAGLFTEPIGSTVAFRVDS